MLLKFVVAEEARSELLFLHIRLTQELAIYPKILFVDAFHSALAALHKLFLDQKMWIGYP